MILYAPHLGFGASCPPFPSEVHKVLFDFGGVEQQIVGSPHSHKVCIQVDGFILPWDKSNYGANIGKYNNVATVVSGREV